MATYNVGRGKHATLGVATVDQVNFSRSGAVLRVANRSTNVDLYFTTDGTDPTVAGDDTYYVAPGTSVVVDGMTPFSQVELISASACAFSAEVY